MRILLGLAGAVVFGLALVLAGVVLVIAQGSDA